jgi:high-affinity Fe2+/Pb2+ permease
MAIEKPLRVSTVTPAKLWFGLIASAVAWVSLGCADILITWRMCKDPEPYGLGTNHRGMTGVLIAVAVMLLAIAILAGMISYHNWRALSREEHLLHADATGRSEFMALLGVIVSVTLGMGIVWLSLPPMIVVLCGRAR